MAARGLQKADGGGSNGHRLPRSIEVDDGRKDEGNRWSIGGEMANLLLAGNFDNFYF